MLFKFSCKINSVSWGLQGYKKKNEGVNICLIFTSSWKFNAQSGFLVLNVLLKFNRCIEDNLNGGFVRTKLIKRYKIQSKAKFCLFCL